jgi:putative transposase
VTKGAGSRAKALAMACKLLMMAKERWRKLNGAHLLPLVRAGIPFVDGVHIELREDQEHRKEAA